MVGLGTMWPESVALAVAVPAHGWSLLLRRNDFLPDPGFAAYHGRNVGGRELALFLPNWAALRWAHVPDNLLSRLETFAKDAAYQVNLQAARASGVRHHGELVERFLRFMHHPK
jgi:hypothetical protein